MRGIGLGVSLTAIAVLLVSADGVWAKGYRFSPQERIDLIRELTALYGTAKTTLPRSKKALPVTPEGQIDQGAWDDAHQQWGPAARPGDLVQITKVELEDDRIVLEINGGFKGGRKWYERIQVGVGTYPPVPVSQRDYSARPVGTKLAVIFPQGIPALKAEQVKEILSNLLDFRQRSATEQYVESLPEPIQAAIKEKRAIEGMERDAVLLAMGKPDRKVREVRDGVEYEDWIYGTPPGKVTFVTFRGNKVVAVKETYAAPGGTVAPPQPPQPEP